MRISTRGRYALRLMIDLAVHDTGEYVPLKEISVRQGITLKYLEQIIPLLVKGGCLKSTRGSSGGYRLSRPPQDYTIGDILRTTEGSLSPIACIEDDPNACPRSADCATVRVWQGLYRVINDYVDSITLADLANEEKSHQGNDFTI